MRSHWSAEPVMPILRCASQKGWSVSQMGLLFELVPGSPIGTTSLELKSLPGSPVAADLSSDAVALVFFFVVVVSLSADRSLAVSDGFDFVFGVVSPPAAFPLHLHSPNE